MFIKHNKTLSTVTEENVVVVPLATVSRTTLDSNTFYMTTSNIYNRTAVVTDCASRIIVTAIQESFTGIYSDGDKRSNYKIAREPTSPDQNVTASDMKFTCCMSLLKDEMCIIDSVTFSFLLASYDINLIDDFPDEYIIVSKDSDTVLLYDKDKLVNALPIMSYSYSTLFLNAPHVKWLSRTEVLSILRLLNMRRTLGKVYNLKASSIGVSKELEELYLKNSVITINSDYKEVIRITPHDDLEDVKDFNALDKVEYHTCYILEDIAKLLSLTVSTELTPKFCTVVDGELKAIVIGVTKLFRLNVPTKKAFKNVNVLTLLQKARIDNLIDLLYINHLLFKGEMYSGKTHMAIEIAKKLDLELYVIPINRQLTKTDLLGHIIDNRYSTTPFRKACEYGGIVLLDELDAADSNILITINMAWNGVIGFPDKTVKLHEDFHIIATSNAVNELVNNVGKRKQDSSVIKRFFTIDFMVDAKARGLEDEVALLEVMRKSVTQYGYPESVVSLRDLAYIKKLFKLGMSSTDVLSLVILNQLEDDTLRKEFLDNTEITAKLNSIKQSIEKGNK